eukprot:gene40556-54847_t
MDGGVAAKQVCVEKCGFIEIIKSDECLVDDGRAEYSGSYTGLHDHDLRPCHGVGVDVLRVGTDLGASPCWRNEHRRDARAGAPEVIGLIVALSITVAGVIFMRMGAASPSGTVDGSPPPAFLLFTIAGIFAAAGELNMLLRKQLSNVSRIARHLWRMCFSLFIASGSFFLGQMQVFPEAIQDSVLLPVLALAPLPVMLFWLGKVRFDDWRRRRAKAAVCSTPGCEWPAPAPHSHPALPTSMSAFRLAGYDRSRAVEDVRADERQNAIDRSLPCCQLTAASRSGKVISRLGFPGYLGASLGSGGRQSKMVNITVIRRVADLPPGFAFQGKSELTDMDPITSIVASMLISGAAAPADGHGCAETPHYGDAPCACTRVVDFYGPWTGG